MIPLAVLLNLADWVQRLRASSTGEDSCQTIATSDPPPRAQPVTLPPGRLWERLSDDDRDRILRVLGWVVARILRLAPTEGATDEHH